jgi:ubiquitin-like protein Pup
MYKKQSPYTIYSSLGDRNAILVQTASEQDKETHQRESSKTPPASRKEKTAQRKTKVAEKGEKLKKDLDEIIDEIDDVLEENADEFIRSYVQRGGE